MDAWNYDPFPFGAFRPIGSFMGPVKWEHPNPSHLYPFQDSGEFLTVNPGCGRPVISPFPPRSVAPRPTWAWHNFVMRWVVPPGVLGVECVNYVGFFLPFEVPKTVEFLVEDQGGNITIVSSGWRIPKKWWLNVWLYKHEAILFTASVCMKLDSYSLKPPTTSEPTSGFRLQDRLESHCLDGS